jgi:dTDP-4-dehydrorhamnose reductase
MNSNNIKVFATGGSGQVGTELVRRGQKWQANLIAPNRSEVDITDFSKIHSALKREMPDIVINSAAFTAVDAAESEKDLAFKVNRDSLEFMASSCKKLSIPLIHLSTDYVFDGAKITAYEEKDPICPIGVYGRSKEAGECIVRDILNDHIILRTSWVYAAHGNNFVKTMLKIGKKRETLNIVNDQNGSPTFAGDIADAVLSIAKQVLCKDDDSSWGTYHYTAKGQTTWKGFAETIFDRAQSYLSGSPVINGIPSGDYPTPAKRPLNSVLNCNKIDLKFAPPRRKWQEGLTEVLDELLQDS